MTENETDILSTSAGPDTRNQQPDLLPKLARAKCHAEEITLLLALVGISAENTISEAKLA